MSIPHLLDHIVIAGPDLPELIDWFAERTGVQAAPGGTHPTGTANALVALTIGGKRGPQYIELIAPNPDRAEPELPQAFAIHTLTAPRVQTYAAHPEDLDSTVARANSSGFPVGPISDLSRRTPSGELLQWRLTRSQQTGFDVPFFIDWADTPQPGLSDIPAIELISFTRIEPDPAALRTRLDLLGLGNGLAAVIEGDQAGYRIELRRADGQVVEL